jgi:hypothetical protein
MFRWAACEFQDYGAYVSRIMWLTSEGQSQQSVQQPEVPARGADGRRDYLVANEVEIGRLFVEIVRHHRIVYLAAGRLLCSNNPN